MRGSRSILRVRIIVAHVHDWASVKEEWMFQVGVAG
jgi:hypothetical protein